MEPQGFCFHCGSDRPRELIVVEGKHAANAVNRVRNKKTQAVIALQGKVPNVVRQGLARCIESSEHVSLLASVLKSSGLSRANSPGKVVVVSDPDADGIHASLLLLCLMSELAPTIIAERRLLLCRSPLALMAQMDCDSDTTMLAYRESDLKVGWRIQRFKGVASLPLDVLYRYCVDARTRPSLTVTAQDCNGIKQQMSALSKR